VDAHNGETHLPDPCCRPLLPTLGKTLVNEIKAPKVRKTLMRIWSTKPATALIVRWRIGQVLD
jgi:hypothetical protein